MPFEVPPALIVSVPLLTVGTDELVINSLSFVRSIVFVGTVMLAVAFELELAVNVVTLVPFF